MKKLMVYRIAALVLLLAGTAFSIGWYTSHRQAEILEHQLAQDNLQRWSRLQEMTQPGWQLQSVEEAEKVALLQNWVIYSVSGSLSPAFVNKEENQTTDSFLANPYDVFAQDVGRGKFQGGEWEQKALDVYRDMNEEIRGICAYVLESAEKRDGAAVELLDNESALSRQVQGKISAFCDRYDEELKAFNAYGAKDAG